MGIENFSLNAPGSRQLPPNLPRGNWADSVHKADIIDGAGAHVDLTQTTLYHLFTFTQDVPIIWDVYGMITAHNAASDPVHNVRAPVAITHSLMFVALQNIVVATVVQCNAWTQITGTSVTNAVPIKGYIGTFSIPDYEIVGEVTTEGQGEVQCISQGAQLFGEPQGAHSAGAAASQGCCYLLETAYTQAMFNAGNRVTLAGVDWKICGLFQASPV